MRHCIYKLTFPNEKVYVGQTKNFKKRMQQHKNKAFNKKSDGYNNYLYCAIRKYGWDNIKKEEVFSCNENLVDLFETEYIKFCKSTQKKFGYNLDSGGSVNKIMSKSSRLKMRNKKLGTKWSASQFDKNNIQIGRAHV